jgi:hypothetical protein
MTRATVVPAVCARCGTKITDGTGNGDRLIAMTLDGSAYGTITAGPVSGQGVDRFDYGAHSGPALGCRCHLDTGRSAHPGDPLTSRAVAAPVTHSSRRRVAANQHVPGSQIRDFQER